MEFIKSTVFFEGGEISSNEKCFCHKDIEFSYRNNKISIRANNTKLFKIRLDFAFSPSPYALFLGDAFERSYGNLMWKKAENTSRMCWYTIVSDGDENYCFGTKTQPNAFCFWHYKNGVMSLEADIRSGTLPLFLDGRTLDVCTVVFDKQSGCSFDAQKKFCKKMCDNPILPPHKIYGGNDWYCCYGLSSKEQIYEHSKRIVHCAPKGAPAPYMVIDAGWHYCNPNPDPMGPWEYPNRKFGNMAEVANEMKKIGVMPGLWFRPLSTLEMMPTEYFLNKDIVPKVLDPSVPEVLLQIRADVARFRDWGYKLIKYDFPTYDLLKNWDPANCEELIAGKLEFSTDRKTTAEIMLDLFRTIREEAGPDILLLACNVPTHLGAGLVHIMRTGDDTSGLEWERTAKMGVNTLAFRLAQDGAFYAVDADCVGFTQKVPFEKNKKWLDLLTSTKTALFVSIAEDSFTDEVRDAVTEAFAKLQTVNKSAIPFDWKQNIRPTKWKNPDGSICEYNWD